MPLEIAKYLAALPSWEEVAQKLEQLARDVSPQLPRRAAFRAYRNAALSVAAGNTFVIMDQKEYDFENEYDTVTGIFQPRYSAVYHITAGVGLNTNQAAGSQLSVEIFRNGGRERYFRFEVLGGAANPQLNGADDFLVKAGDLYQVRVSVATNPTAILANTNATWFSARHVRDL